MRRKRSCHERSIGIRSRRHFYECQNQRDIKRNPMTEIFDFVQQTHDFIEFLVKSQP